MQNHRRDGGFTLTEVLVAVSIIAVLAAFFLPAVSRSFATNAMKAKTVSNLRQLGVASQQYFSENNMTLPGPAWVSVPYLLTPAEMTASYRPYTAFLSQYLPFQATPDGNSLLPLAQLKANNSSISYYFRIGMLLLTAVPQRPFGNTGGVAPLSVLQLPRIYNIPLSKFVLLQTTDGQDALSVGAAVPTTPLVPGVRFYLFVDAHIEPRALNDIPAGFR